MTSDRTKVQTKPRTRTHEWDASIDWVDSDGRRWKVSVDLRRIMGRLVIGAMMIEPARRTYGLTRKVLAEVPLIDFAREVVATDPTALETARLKSAPHHGRRHTDEELQMVADLYLQAYESHLPVQRAVCEGFHIPMSTAAKRIMAARQRGFIPPDINERTTK